MVIENMSHANVKLVSILACVRVKGTARLQHRAENSPSRERALLRAVGFRRCACRPRRHRKTARLTDGMRSMTAHLRSGRGSLSQLVMSIQGNGVDAGLSSSAPVCRLTTGLLPLGFGARSRDSSARAPPVWGKLIAAPPGQGQPSSLTHSKASSAGDRLMAQRDANAV